MNLQADENSNCTEGTNITIIFNAKKEFEHFKYISGASDYACGKTELVDVDLHNVIEMVDKLTNTYNN